jgi:hypothetical protein
VSGLASKIAGDWFDIREAASDIDRLQDILLTDPRFARLQQRKLLTSVEEGTVEYKRAVLLETFATLEEANFRTFVSGDYRAVELRLAFLCFVSLVQRNLANGTIAIRGSESPQTESEPAGPTPEIREIMHDIRNRVRSNPDNRRLPQIKNILMQINKYSREVDALKKLIRTAPEDKKPAYVRNFRKSTDEIFSKIKRQYTELVAEERLAAKQPPDNPLLRHELKPLTPIFAAQAEGFASIVSTVVYARTEADRIRETLVTAAGRRDEMLALVVREHAAYQRLEEPNNEESGLRTGLARAFARELVAVLDRCL